MISLRSLISIQTIMVVRLLGGLYYNISSNRFITLAARLYCTFFSTTLVYFFTNHMLSFPVESIIFIISCLFQYIICAIVNFLTNGEHFSKFLTELEKVDFLLGSKPKDDIAISRIIFIGMVINTIVITALPCFAYYPKYNCLSLAFVTTLGFILDLSTDLSSFTSIMMFEVMWCRMALLRKRLEKELSVARQFESGEKRREKNLRNCMMIYNNLVKTSLQCDVPMKFMTCFSTINLFPRILVVVYNCISTGKTSLEIINTVLTILQSFYPLIPAFFAEMVDSETDKIKLCVIKQLLVCKDTNYRDAVEDAVRFLEQRRFRYTIWRLYTLDITLILTIFGMITTYTVAMIEFAHFYD